MKLKIAVFALCFINWSVVAAQCENWIRNDSKVLATFKFELSKCSNIQPKHSKDIEVLERIASCEVAIAESARDAFCTPALKETWRVLKFLYNENLKLNAMLVRGELPHDEHERLTAIIYKMQLQEIAKGHNLAIQQLDQVEAAGSAAYWTASANQKIQEGFQLLKPKISIAKRERWITVTDRNGNSVGVIDNGGGFNSQGSFYSNNGKYIGFVDTGGGFNSHGSVYDKNGNYVGKISP